MPLPEPLSTLLNAALILLGVLVAISLLYWLSPFYPVEGDPEPICVSFHGDITDQIRPGDTLDSFSTSGEMSQLRVRNCAYVDGEGVTVVEAVPEWKDRERI